VSELATVTEVHPALTETAARELTDTIKRAVQIVDSQITRAYFGRAWSALGYETWDEYCESEFDGAKLKMPREERTMIVGSLRDAGMSIRAIAAATGASYGTVHSELAAGDQKRSPDDDDSIIDAEVVEPRETPKVTGIDGKSYPARPGPKPKTEAVRQLAELGLSADQIADDLGITAARVFTIARANGIKLPGSQLDREERWQKVAEMAARGHTSGSIAAEVGLNVDHLREAARAKGIDIPADALMFRTRNLDSERIVRETVRAIDGIGILFPKVVYADLNPEDVKGWLPVLDDSIRSLTTLRNQLKKVSQP
jgi:lambda repressor-like predicted transcriptional regulator